MVLRCWMELAGLAVHQRCAKRSRPVAICDLCPPLPWPMTKPSHWAGVGAGWLAWAVRIDRLVGPLPAASRGHRVEAGMLG